MDEYKTKLRKVLEEYAKECEYKNADEFFFRAGKNDYDYQYMSEMDQLSLRLDDHGALQFAISYTRQGEQGDPYIDVSYYSHAIGKQISWGEHMPNIKGVDEFVAWAAETKAEMLALEKQLTPRVLVAEVEGGILQDIHGLPEGWTYEVADYDDDTDTDAEVAEKDAMIARAKAL